MLPPELKFLVAALSIISYVISFFAASAGWYRDCLKVSKARGYIITFLPLLIAIVVSLSVYYEVLPEEYVDDVYTLSGTAGTALLLIAAYKQVRGQCTPCDVSPTQ